MPARKTPTPAADLAAPVAPATPAAPVKAATAAKPVKAAKSARKSAVVATSPAKVPAKVRAKVSAKPVSKTLPQPQPKAPAKPETPAPKAAKPRDKLVRDSFTMPQADFALIEVLKQQALGFKRPTKKSELLRAGLQALAAMPPAALKVALGRLVPLKTGRPKKGG